MNKGFKACILAIIGSAITGFMVGNGFEQHQKDALTAQEENIGLLADENIQLTNDLRDCKK